MTRGVFALALVAALLVGVTVPGADAAAPRSARVAIIVGPAGSVTDSYRALADAAAREARRWSTDVVTVYSPDATWPAVRQALEGASVVVYLGHGNGWPSRYRDSLAPRTQNGFGLNPVAGVDDVAHQYFGESDIARSVHLAPGAVVVLSHLCYASGNTEPGLPVGTLEQSTQRVDNFAAGFIAAGAVAVVAETTSGPAYYTKAFLSGRQDVETVWRAAPTFNDHVLTFASRRTPGAALLLDPDRPLSGFHRSLVLVGHPVTPGPGGAGQIAVPVGPPPPPSLASLGVRISAPAFDDLPVAGTTRAVTIPLTLPPAFGLPAGIGLGVRWEAIELDPLAPGASPARSPAPGASPAPSPAPGTSPTPSPGPSASPGASPAPTPPPGSSPAPTAPAPATREPLPEPPDVQLVAPEAGTGVVDVARTEPDGAGLRATIAVPSIPGRYRLVLTLHDPDGVAYDAATQAMLPALAVRVTGSVSAAYAVTPDVVVEAGHEFTLPVRVANTGTVAWGFGTGPAPEAQTSPAGPSVAVPWVMGHWVRLVGTDTTAPPSAGAPVLVQPGDSALAPLDLVAPATTGAYLLLVDTVTPAQGSLAALGIAPAIVRVTVVTPTPDSDSRHR